MYRGFKNQVKRIEVQPVCANDTMQGAGSNVNAASDKRVKFYSMNVKSKMEKDPFDIRESIANTITIADENTSRLQKIAAAFKTIEIVRADVDVPEKEPKTYVALPAKTVSDDAEVKCDHTENGRKEKKKTKKKKKNKNKVHALDGSDESEPKHRETKPDGLKNSPQAEITKAAEIVEPTGCCAKLPVFGFISTWMGKRKERRREKKRKAIAARSASQMKPLVEYEHKKSKGGMAFTVEVDDRPMRKSVLPPIKQKPGGVMNDIEKKLKMAEKKREKELSKKKLSSKEQYRKQAECQERKADSEFHYKQKVDLTIKTKQCVAEKNRKRIHSDPTILRAPSTLPPLRVIRVKPAAGTDTNPDDDLFDF